MAIADITKPMALDETLQATNDKLQAIADALGNQSIIGDTDISDIADGTLTGAVAQFDGDITDLGTDKADKVTGATAGNLAGLNGSGNLTDSGWNGAKDTTSISGNPISISGLKSNQLAVNPIITFEPIQAGSGTPSPSNVRAISGYDKVEVESCGKNIFDGEMESGAYNAQGQKVENSSRYRNVNPIPVGGNTSYTYSRNGTVRGGNMFLYDANMVFLGMPTLSGGVFTTYANARYLNFYDDQQTGLQLEQGSSVSALTPYHKTTSISESLGQTVYGGTLDIRSGKFTVTHGMVDLGSLDWHLANNNVFYSSDDVGAAKKDGITCICSIYSAISNVPNTESMTVDKSVALMNSSTNLNRVYIRDTSQSSTPAFTTAVTGQKLVYELATPFTIQLTPHEISLLKDYAYVSTNGTSIALDYHNGELASLGDVSQLGETVNELGNGCILGDSKYIGYLTPSAYLTWEEINIDIEEVKKYKFIVFGVSPNSGRFIQVSTIPVSLLLNMPNTSFDTAYSSSIEARIKYTSNKLYMYLTESGWNLQLALMR